MMRKVLASLVLISLLVTSTVMVTVAQEPTDEPTEQVSEEPTVEPTEEPTVEPTEEPTVEPTEEPTAEPTEEPTVEPTEEPTAEPTEEPTVEPTEEPTVEPTEEPTVEPTATLTPTVEITTTATTTPTQMSAQGDIGAQAYAGTWTTYVAVQNMGTISTNIGIDWYKNGETNWCAQTTDTGLLPGVAKQYTPPEGACGDSWVGSAVVLGGEPIAAVAETLGSVANLASAYLGGSEPTTDPLILPMLSNTKWDPLIGISNAGSGQATVKVTLLKTDGTPFDSTTVLIPAQSGRQLSVRTDITSTAWVGTIRVENDGTSEPLYAVTKAERQAPGQPYPVSIAFEAMSVNDGRDEWLVPAIHKRTWAATGIPYGQNGTIGLMNPTGTATTATVRWFNMDGSEILPSSTVALPANGTGWVITRDTPQIPEKWAGTALISTSLSVDIIAQIQPWVATNTKTGYNAWAIYNPVDPNAGTDTAYVPTVHKESSGDARIGRGWCSTVVAVNLSSTDVTTVTVEIFDPTTGVAAYTEERGIPANGMEYWYTLKSYMDAGLGTNFFSGARVTVTGGPGPIVAIAQETLTGYRASTPSDAYAFYNGVNR